MNLTQEQIIRIKLKHINKLLEKHEHGIYSDHSIEERLMLEPIEMEKKFLEEVLNHEHTDKYLKDNFFIGG